MREKGANSRMVQVVLRQSDFFKAVAISIILAISKYIVAWYKSGEKQESLINKEETQDLKSAQWERIEKEE